MSLSLYLLFAPAHVLSAVLLRPPRSEDSTLPSLGVTCSCLLRVFHYYCMPFRERYSFALPLASALLLVLEFSALQALLERGPASRSPAAAAAAASPASPASPFSTAAAARLRDHDPRRRRAAERSILDLRLSDAWRWTDLPSYLLCTLGAAILLLLLTALLLPRPPQWYTACLGALAVASEATLYLPRLASALAGGPQRQRASYLGGLCALACAGVLLAQAQPLRPLPRPFVLAPCLAAACEVAVLASSELAVALAPLGSGGAAGAPGGSRAQKAV